MGHRGGGNWGDWSNFLGIAVSSRGFMEFPGVGFVFSAWWTPRWPGIGVESEGAAGVWLYTFTPPPRTPCSQSHLVVLGQITFIYLFFFCLLMTDNTEFMDCHLFLGIWQNHWSKKYGLWKLLPEDLMRLWKIPGSPEAVSKLEPKANSIIRSWNLDCLHFIDPPF